MNWWEKRQARLAQAMLDHHNRVLEWERITGDLFPMGLSRVWLELFDPIWLDLRSWTLRQPRRTTITQRQKHS